MKTEDIQELFAFVSQAPGGGIIAVHAGADAFPLVTSEKHMVEKMKPMARQAAKEAKYTVKLLRFSNREELESFG